MQALWMVASALFFTLMGVCVKYASAGFHSFELVFWRGVIGMLFLAVLAAGVALFMWLRFYICAPAAAAIVAALFAVAGVALLCKGRSVSKNGGGPAE